MMTAVYFDAFERAWDVCTCQICEFVRDELVLHMVDKGVFASICEKRRYDEIHMHHLELHDVLFHIMLRVFMRIVDEPNNRTHNIPFLIKIPRKQQLLESYMIHSEITLYNVVNSNIDTMKDTIVPKCYKACFWNVTLLPVIILEDITRTGYKQLNGKLNETHMRICMRDLAKFHASALKLFKKNTFLPLTEQMTNLEHLTIDKSAIR
jgi:hypothetical protein